MAGVSVCRSCGEAIRWAKRSDGNGTHRPLDMASEQMRFYVDTRGRVQKVPTYELHVCTDERSEAYAAEKIAEANERAELDDFRAARAAHDAHAETEKFQRAVYELAMVYECPKCDAAIGQPCENLTARHSGTVKYTAAPHQERKLLIPHHLHPYWSAEGYVVTPHTQEHP